MDQHHWKIGQLLPYMSAKWAAPVISYKLPPKKTRQLTTIDVSTINDSSWSYKPALPSTSIGPHLVLCLETFLPCSFTQVRRRHDEHPTTGSTPVVTCCDVLLLCYTYLYACMDHIIIPSPYY